MRRFLPALLLVLATGVAPRVALAAEVAIKAYALPAGGGHPHDVAVEASGIVWYTAQHDGKLGRLDPATGKVDLVPLGRGSRPHGVIIGPDGHAWVTEGGQNAIAKVDVKTRAVKVWKLPQGRGYANLNTASFDKRGRIWFTGQSGIYGVLDPASGKMQVWDAPQGRGPYGITTTPGGDVYYASLAGDHIARIDIETGKVTVIEPPTKEQGARRVWSDSKGRIWVSEWNAGNLSRYDPVTNAWRTWKLPGASPHVYAVYVDAKDIVWVSEWTANAIVRFDPATGKFQVFPSDKADANVRQLLGRPGEVWAPESGAYRLVVYRTRPQ
jgi:virginiamycin B lyase